MQIIEKKPSELLAYENNPRNNDGAVDAVAASIREFGFKVPIIIDRDGVIVAGHTRLKAAERLGLETVPCVVADDLTPEQVKAFRLADNKVGEFSEWDYTRLIEEHSKIHGIDMEQFGFSNMEDKAIDTYFDEPKPKGKERESVVCPCCGESFFVDEAEVIEDDDY